MMLPPPAKNFYQAQLTLWPLVSIPPTLNILRIKPLIEVLLLFSESRETVAIAKHWIWRCGRWSCIELVGQDRVKQQVIQRLIKFSSRFRPTEVVVDMRDSRSALEPDLGC